MVIVNYTWLGIRVEALQSWNAFVNRNDVKGFDFWFSDDIVVGLMKLARTQPPGPQGIEYRRAGTARMRQETRQLQMCVSTQSRRAFLQERS